MFKAKHPHPCAPSTTARVLAPVDVRMFFQVQPHTRVRDRMRDRVCVRIGWKNIQRYTETTHGLDYHGIGVADVGS